MSGQACWFRGGFPAAVLMMIALTGCGAFAMRPRSADRFTEPMPLWSGAMARGGLAAAFVQEPAAAVRPRAWSPWDTARNEMLPTAQYAADPQSTPMAELMPVGHWSDQAREVDPTARPGTALDPSFRSSREFALRR